MCFEMATSTKSLSASYMSIRYTVTERTARLFMHKVREAMKSSENNPMGGDVHVDEFVLGGKEEGKIRRMYAIAINDFSAKSLSSIFEKHIDKKAQITTDLWRGYRPLSKSFKID